MTFILSILVLIALIFFFVLSVAGNLIRAIFGTGRKDVTNKHKQGTKVQRPSSKKAKIIDKSEGEYVDFEEIKN